LTVALDNRPLWKFIGTNPVPSPIPASCQPSNFSPGSKAKMQSCLADYLSGGYTGPMFSARSPETPPGLYDIQLSPRLAFVPTLNPCSCGDSGQYLGSIQSFNLIFLQTTYLTPLIEFNPGEGGLVPLAITQFDGVSALRITDAMVSSSVVATGTNGALRGARVQLSL
jgi:hypothetical protein